MAQGLPLVPPADHVVVPRAVYDRLRHAWNDRVLEASVGLPHPDPNPDPDSHNRTYDKLDLPLSSRLNPALHLTLLLTLPQSPCSLGADERLNL